MNKPENVVVEQCWESQKKDLDFKEEMIKIFRFSEDNKYAEPGEQTLEFGISGPAADL